MNRWPTIPVAPIIPARSLCAPAAFCILSVIVSYPMIRSPRVKRKEQAGIQLALVGPARSASGRYGEERIAGLSSASGSLYRPLGWGRSGVG